MENLNKNEEDKCFENTRKNSPLQGWQCPVCKRVYSPFVGMCQFCGGEDLLTSKSYNYTTSNIINP